MGEQDRRPSEDHIRRSKQLVKILLPALREAARRNGYALAVHGSLERDIDLIAAPWREGATSADSLIADLFTICKAVLGFATWPGGWKEGDSWEAPVGSLPNPDRKPHGRLGWSILLSGGPYFDISVMPRAELDADAKRGHDESGALASLVLRAYAAEDPRAVLEQVLADPQADGFRPIDMSKLLPTEKR